MNNKKYCIYILIFIIIFLLGVFLRCNTYLYQRSLWLDECYLFENIYNRGFFDFFSTLLYSQSAPPLFLMLEKLIVNTFGFRELTLRFIPFLASIISIPVFYFFSKQFLTKSISIIAASLFFAVNIHFIYYAQELKQYSSDVLCFMILFMILNKISVKNIQKKDIVIYVVISILFPLFSLTTYFLIFAWILRELILYRKELKNLLIIQAPMIVMSYFYFTKALLPQRIAILECSGHIWGNSYLSSDFVNNFIILKHVIEYYFNPCLHWVLYLMLISIGIFLFAKNYKQKENLLLFLILPIIIIASFCHIYPLYGRSILFALPIIIIFLTKSIDFISIDRKIISTIIIILFIIAFSGYNFSYFKHCYHNNIWFCRFAGGFCPDPSGMMKELVEKYKSSDTVIINEASTTEYNYYKKIYKFNPNKEIYTDDTVRIYKDCEKKLYDITQPNNSYWFFYSDDYSSDNMITKCLRKWKDQYHILEEKQFSSSYLLYLNIDH